MKIGDKVPVNIAGDVAGQAEVTAVDMETRQVTLVIPATRVIMALKVELDSAPAPVEEPTTQTIITGVDRYDAEGNLIPGGSTSAPGESATVVESAPNTETPVGSATQEEVTPVTPVEAPVEQPAPVVESSTNTDG